MASREQFEVLANKALSKAFYSGEQTEKKLNFISTVGEYFRVSKGMDETSNEAYYQKLEEVVEKF